MSCVAKHIRPHYRGRMSLATQLINELRSNGQNFLGKERVQPAVGTNESLGNKLSFVSISTSLFYVKRRTELRSGCCVVFCLQNFAEVSLEHFCKALSWRKV